MSQNARFRLFVMIVSSYHHYLTHTFSGRCVCVGCILEAVVVSTTVLQGFIWSSDCVERQEKSWPGRGVRGSLTGNHQERVSNTCF